MVTDGDGPHIKIAKETTGVCRQWQKLFNCLTCLLLELFCYFLRLMTFTVVSLGKRLPSICHDLCINFGKRSPSIRKMCTPGICDKQENNSKIVRVSKAKTCGKKCPVVPPLDHFQGKNENRSSLAKTISALIRSFFVNLTTFERRTGLKKFSLLKIAILKMGWLSKFQSHRSWGDAHLSFGVAQAPPTKMGST